MPFQDSTNLNNITKYIVDGNGDTPYLTIQQAVNAANTAGVPAAVYIRAGTYTENLTLYDGIDIVGENEQATIIVGTHVPPTTGYLNLFRATFRSATNIFNSAAAGTTRIIMEDCSVEVTNGYTFNLVNWTGDISVFDMGNGGTNDGFINNTGGSSFFCFSSGFGNGTLNTMNVSGVTVITTSDGACPIDFQGASTVDITNSSFTETITTSATATVAIKNSSISTVANTAIVHGSANELSLSDVTIDTSNVATIAGAGAGNLLMGSVTYLDTSAVAGTLTPIFTTRLETGSLKIANADQGAFAINAGVCTSIQGQNILYVGKHGNDANDGLVWENAFLTINAAVTAAAAGDTIQVDPGTYTETITHAANNLTVIARGKPNTCIITQADANVINLATFTGIQYKYFTISCTAATTAINTIDVSTGSGSFKECKLRMITAADIAAVIQPSIARITAAGSIEVIFGKHAYLHTGNGGGTAQKGAFKVANGSTISLGNIEEIIITNSGTALVSSIGIDTATTGTFEMHDCNATITDPDATFVVGLAYLGGTGVAHEFFRNIIHVIATNNTGYGFYASDTASISRFFYNHLHITDVAGASYSYHIGNTATVISHFDDIVSGDGNQLIGAGVFTQVSSEEDGDLSVTNLTQHAPVIGGGINALSSLGPLTNGQLVIGSTGLAPAAASLLSANSTVTITAGAGSIDLAVAGGGVAWSVETGATVAATVNKGYITNRAAGITYTLPSTAAVGSVIRIAGLSGIWTIAQNAGEYINFGLFTTTVGVGGTLVATDENDAIEIVNIVADTGWTVISVIGNITVN